MLSPAYSFAWLLWRQHGRGLLVVLGYLLIAGAVPAFTPMLSPDDVSPAVQRNILELVIKPLTFLPMLLLPFYMMVVFAYGLEVVDVSGRDSCFPARLFQLPVRTDSLTVWPIAYGAAVTVLLWLVIAYFILEPWQELDFGYRSVPLWWPGVLAAAALACIQAALWSPFGLPWLRVILLAALLPILLMFVNFAVNSGTSEALLVGLFAIIAAVAWCVAFAGVRRARGGTVTNWDWLLWPVHEVAGWLPQSRTAFASAAIAHTWYEWRASRYALPIMVAMGLALFLWAFLIDSGRIIATETMLQAKYLPILWSPAIPVLCAGIGGGWLGTGKNRWVKDSSGMMPFIATLPMSTADMVDATLRTAVWSTLAAWAVVIVTVPLVVVLTGNLDEMLVLLGNVLENEWRGQTPLEIFAWFLAVAALLVVWTWKRLVCRLWLGMTGRKWLEVSLGWGRLPAFAGLYFAMVWIDHQHYSRETNLAVLTWLIGLLMLCRVVAVAWALRQVVRQGLLEARTVNRWVAGWLLVASTLFAVLVWAALDRVPMYYLAAAVLFVMPMARLAAMPLALAWNRHR